MQTTVEISGSGHFLKDQRRISPHTTARPSRTCRGARSASVLPRKYRSSASAGVKNVTTENPAPINISRNRSGSKYDLHGSPISLTVDLIFARLSASRASSAASGCENVKTNSDPAGLAPTNSKSPAIARSSRYISTPKQEKKAGRVKSNPARSNPSRNDSASKFTPANRKFSGNSTPLFANNYCFAACVTG